MSFSSFFSAVNRRGQILDLLVFLANLFVLGPFTRLLQRLGQGFTANDDAAAKQLALIVLAAFLAYIAGAMLKRAPLHERRATLPSPGYAGCLFIGWIALHLSLSILGASLIAASFDAAPKGIPLIAMILFSLLPTIFAARVIIPPRRLESIRRWRKRRLMELFADLLIVSAVIMLTVMWDIWIAGIFANTWPNETFAEKLFGAGMAAGAFALFYVTPRFLFLIEDFNRWGTWATIGLTLAPVIFRSLVGGPAH